MCYCKPHNRTPVCDNCARYLDEENAKLREQLADSDRKRFENLDLARESLAKLEAAEAKLNALALNNE